MAPHASVSLHLGSRFAKAGRWFAPHSNSGVVERMQPQPLEGTSSFASHPPSIAHIRHASLDARSDSPTPPSHNIATPILATLFGLLLVAGAGEFA